VKIRITLLTSSVLCLILFALDAFIYFTLYSHVYNLELASVSTKAQSVAQYYASHNDEGKNNSSSSPLAWLQRYEQDGQTLVILDTHGHLISGIGHDIKQLQSAGLKMPTAQADAVMHSTSGHLILIQPVLSDDGNRLLSYVILDVDTSTIQDYMHTLLALLIAGSFGAIVLSAIGGYAVAASSVRPIQNLMQLVDRISINQLHERLAEPKRRDEVAQLAITFNRMMARMERSVEKQSRFVADASHEIRTPLTTIQGYANLLARWGKRDPDVLDKAIRAIQKESSRLRSLANNLLTLANLDSPAAVSATCDVCVVVHEVNEALEVASPAVQIQLLLHCPAIAAIHGPHLKQILFNLIDNAVKYSDASSQVHVNVALQGKGIEIQVKDQGRGIPAEDLPYVFDRFYRVDKSRTRRGGGSGLGLSIVKELIVSYHGEIVLESTAGKGTTVRVWLPGLVQ